MSAPKQEKQIFGMTLGADPKQLAALGGLVVLLLIVWWVMRDPSDSAPSSTTAQATRPAKGTADPEAPVRARGAERAEAPGGPRRQGSRQALTAVKEFRPSLKIDPDNPIDPAQTDPTIRFAALNKVQEVAMTGGGRSVFDFGAMNAAGQEIKPGDAVKIKPVKVIPIYGPEKPAPLPPPPPAPPPPAIPLKFYGFVHTARGVDQRRAFFMENEDIYIASEGDLIKKRYKLVKIGINSAVLEDTMVKNNRQTIKLTEEAKSN
ncbi:MAG TPA: hypothetical protein VGL53_14995 [Bryobacteraceae bacterium]|jgi:hypothetical protein